MEGEAGEKGARKVGIIFKGTLASVAMTKNYYFMPLTTRCGVKGMGFLPGIRGYRIRKLITHISVIPKVIHFKFYFQRHFQFRILELANSVTQISFFSRGQLEQPYMNFYPP